MQIAVMKARRGESEGSGFKSLCQTKEFFLVKSLSKFTYSIILSGIFYIIPLLVVYCTDCFV